MRIAGIQMSAGPDVERNIKRAVEMAEVAAEKDVRVICYPELFLTPWFPKKENRSLFSLAISSLGETLGRFQRVSEKTGTVLIVPFFESVSGKGLPVMVDLEPGTHSWCSCGKSKTEPFCDGSHEGTSFVPLEFVVDVKKKAGLCTCGRTKKPPYCDGTHAKV